MKKSNGVEQFWFVEMVSEKVAGFNDRNGRKRNWSTVLW